MEAVTVRSAKFTQRQPTRRLAEDFIAQQWTSLLQQWRAWIVEDAPPQVLTVEYRLDDTLEPGQRKYLVEYGPWGFPTRVVLSAPPWRENPEDR
ncbi:MAG: hypothetical protein Kow00109_29360 [Acidobacteriota bacterium]